MQNERQRLWALYNPETETFENFFSTRKEARNFKTNETRVYRSLQFMSKFLNSNNTNSKYKWILINTSMNSIISIHNTREDMRRFRKSSYFRFLGSTKLMQITSEDFTRMMQGITGTLQENLVESN